jgi:hypothetical protein
MLEPSLHAVVTQGELVQRTAQSFILEFTQTINTYLPKVCYLLEIPISVRCLNTVLLGVCI